MALKLYNTLTRKKEAFKPMKGKEVKLYSCGPTVYDFAHIGNFRAYVCVDILKRYLEYLGYKVNHVMNITDVDDKTIKGAREKRAPLKEFTKEYAKAFFDDLETLNIEKADMYPKATEHIGEMSDIVKILLDRKIAYRTNDGIYFDISKFRKYGKLSHAKLESLEAGKRIRNDQYEKDQARDFVLWKFWDSDDGDIFWNEPIGKGRPGWHLECSAMSTKYLGQPFDIHAGGIDLVFPHHENEIAQSESCSGKKLANYWFHNEHLLVDGKKMSKSLGNFHTLRDLLKKGHDARAIRYLLLSSHYRQQLNFTVEGINAAKSSVSRVNEFMLRLKEVKSAESNEKIRKLVESTKKAFEKEMDDDLNISNALAVIFDFMKKVNTLMMKNTIGKDDAGNIRNLMIGFDKVLGILETEEEKIPSSIMKLVADREKARKEKDFKKADIIREELSSKGYVLKDTKEGPRLRKA